MGGMMKRCFPMTVLTALVAVTTLWAQPKLEVVGGTTYNWGTVSFRQSPLKADIVLKNTGTDVLHLQNPQPGCGCTTAPLDDRELQPGEQTTMHVTLTLSGTGPISKSIALISDDPTARAVVVELKATIERALQLGPTSYLVFGDMEQGKPATATVTISNTSSSDITLSGFTATNGVELNYREPVVLGAGQSLELTATAVSSVVGYFNTTVAITTTHPDYPTLEFQGYGTVTEPKQSKVFGR